LKLSNTFKVFFESEKSGGIILLLATLLSLFLANLPIHAQYLAFWETAIGNKPLSHWINDGLMTLFFLMIGLELEREIYDGELSSVKNASLPILGAIGGMLVPAGIFLVLNFGTKTQNGAGIPMATDIAFAIGILSLLGNRVPASLKIFLTALAVIDDLGAILVIALFYTKTIIFWNLAIAFGIMGVLFLFNRRKIHNLLPYLIGGVGMWYFMLHSGVHPTITGVLLAFVIPFGDGDKQTASYKLQHFLHQPVAFFILPLFAMANTCITITNGWSEGLSQTNSIGIILGLVIGKPLGILLFCILGVRLRISTLPNDIEWKTIFGAGILGGIGFTMSVFITLLAFDEDTVVTNSKIAILIASFLAGSLGYVWLRFCLKKVNL
jgi:Na+:H+ antiporter, NhaA family